MRYGFFERSRVLGVCLLSIGFGGGCGGADTEANLRVEAVQATRISGFTAQPSVLGVEAESAVEQNGLPTVVISSTPNSCRAFEKKNLPASSVLLSFFFFDLDAAGAPHPPTKPGTFAVLDYSALAGTRLAPGPYAVVARLVTDSYCTRIPSELATAASGAVRVDSIKGEEYQGSLTANFANGEKLVGPFHSHFCKALTDSNNVVDAHPCGPKSCRAALEFFHHCPSANSDACQKALLAQCANRDSLASEAQKDADLVCSSTVDCRNPDLSGCIGKQVVKAPLTAAQAQLVSDYCATCESGNRDQCVKTFATHVSSPAGVALFVSDSIVSQIDALCTGAALPQAGASSCAEAFARCELPLLQNIFPPTPPICEPTPPSPDGGAPDASQPH